MEQLPEQKGRVLSPMEVEALMEEGTRLALAMRIESVKLTHPLPDYLQRQREDLRKSQRIMGADLRITMTC